MTTVKQLREFLATLPDDTEVRVLETITRNWETYTKFVPLELPEKADHPFTNNLSVFGNHLDLGEE